MRTFSAASTNGWTKLAQTGRSSFISLNKNPVKDWFRSPLPSRNRPSPSFHPIILVILAWFLSRVLIVARQLLQPQPFLPQPCPKQEKGIYPWASIFLEEENLSAESPSFSLSSQWPELGYMPTSRTVSGKRSQWMDERWRELTFHEYLLPDTWIKFEIWLQGRKGRGSCIGHVAAGQVIKNFSRNLVSGKLHLWNKPHHWIHFRDS